MALTKWIPESDPMVLRRVGKTGEELRMNLPPFPEPAGLVAHEGGLRCAPWVSTEAAYTASQMHAYAQQCVLAERERAVRLILDHPYWIGTQGKTELAAAIRKEPTP